MIQTLIISIGIIAVMIPLVIVIVLYGNIGAGKSNRAADLYDHLATQHALNFTYRDVFGSKTLALDEAKKILVFIDNGKEAMHRTIPLKNVSGSKIVKSGISTIKKTDSGGYTFQDRSKDFSFALLLKNGSIIDLPLYSEMREGASQRDRIMSLARNWKRKIDSLIGHNSYQIA